MRLDEEALNRFSNELIVAKERLEHFERLAEMSMMKTSVVEENIRRV
jgi:hypothetical protein